jgi:hypothetical protein
VVATDAAEDNSGIPGALDYTVPTFMFDAPASSLMPVATIRRRPAGRALYRSSIEGR